ncbi:substrate-binding periplasmic protein [Thalassospira sp.]|uniref:substrate-binding periplasmic protein n=1 Tax=Thalassospira sp. TaxID=1912094 RepID=UPI003AA8CF97
MNVVLARLFHVFFVFGVMLVLTMSQSAAAQNSDRPTVGHQQTVTLACNPFPPSKINSGAVLPGYDVEILRAAFATRNIELITPFYPWQRAYFLAKTGQVDGLCSCSYLIEREEHFLYSQLIGNVRVAFYATNDSVLAPLEKIDDARNMTVGVVNGYNLEAAARKAGLDVMTVNSETILINMLLSARLDMVLSYKAPMDSQLHDAANKIRGLDTIRSKVISNNPYYSCIARKAKNAHALINELNTGLATIRENGLFERIHAKYGILRNDMPN